MPICDNRAYSCLMCLHMPMCAYVCSRAVPIHIMCCVDPFNRACRAVLSAMKIQHDTNNSTIRNMYNMVRVDTSYCIVSWYGVQNIKLYVLSRIYIILEWYVIFQRLHCSFRALDLKTHISLLDYRLKPQITHISVGV